MHTLCHLRSSLPSSSLTKHGSSAYTIIKRFYTPPENPKWTAQAEEQFSELFKVKEKTPDRPSPPKSSPPSQEVKAHPPSTPHSKITPSTPHADFKLPPPSQQISRPDYRSRSKLERPSPVTHHLPDEIPGVPNFGDQYAEATRMRKDEARPSKPFEQLEEEERAPQLADEKSNVIKLWVENLPLTDEAVIEQELNLVADSPVSVSGMEVVTERGMIATKSAFLTVNFGDNNRERLFYKLENFGLTIKGMRCPVRTAEVKRSLTLIELGQISEATLVAALKEQDIQYTTYDYPQRYNSPQRQIAFPYRGSVVLTFRSHQEAFMVKQRFDSEEGVMIGENRIYAMWGPRAGSAPLEIRTAANYMRNLIWENRDLRRYVTQARQKNITQDWQEPEGFARVATIFDKDGSTQQRQSALDELNQKLEETKKALLELREQKGAANGEELEAAEKLLEKGSAMKHELTNELATETVQNRSVLSGLGSTRSISPFVPKIEDTKVLTQVEEEFDKSLAALKARHNAEMRRLKAVHDEAKKKVVQEVFNKNHRNKTETAAELGMSRQVVAKHTTLKKFKKKVKNPISSKIATTEDSAEADGTEAGETVETVATEQNGEPIQAKRGRPKQQQIDSTPTEDTEEGTEIVNSTGKKKRTRVADW